MAVCQVVTLGRSCAFFVYDSQEIQRIVLLSLSHSNIVKTRFTHQDVHCLTPTPMCDRGQCYATCPFGDAAMPNSTICISRDDCNKAGRVTFNGTCVTNCPTSAPFFKPDPLFGSQCCSQCPYGDVVMPNSTICISDDDCNKAGRVTFNGTCVKNCPQSAPLFKPEPRFGSPCCSQCPLGDVANNSVCISSDNCLKAGWRVFNHQCVSKCPPGTRKVHQQYMSDDTCQTTVTSLTILGVSVVCLAVVTLACIFVLRNPGKRKKKVKQIKEEQEPLIRDNGQRNLLDGESYAADIFVRRQPMHLGDTSLKEVTVLKQPTHDVNTSVKEIHDWDATSVKGIPQLNRVNELVAIGYQDGRAEQYFREDDELSSIPTVVALKGFQSSDDSLSFTS